MQSAPTAPRAATTPSSVSTPASTPPVAPRIPIPTPPPIYARFAPHPALLAPALLSASPVLPRSTTSPTPVPVSAILPVPTAPFLSTAAVYSRVWPAMLAVLLAADRWRVARDAAMGCTWTAAVASTPVPVRTVLSPRTARIYVHRVRLSVLRALRWSHAAVAAVLCYFSTIFATRAAPIHR